MRRNEPGDRYFEYIKGLFEQNALAFLPSMRNKHALDVLQTIGTRVLGSVAGFCTSIIIARVLGPEGRGEYFLVVTIAATIAQFGNFGLHSSNFYQVSQDNDLAGRLTANSLWVSLGVGLASFLIVVGIKGLGWLPLIPLSISSLAALLGAAMLFLMLCVNLLVGTNRIAVYNGTQLGNSLLVLGAILTAGVLGLGVEGFLLAIVSATLVSCALTLAVLGWKDPIPLLFNSKLFLSGVGYSAKAYMVALLPFLILRLSVFLIQTFKGSEELGYFSIASQVVDVLALFPASVALILFPRLVRAQKSRYRIMTQGLLVVAGGMAALCVAAAVLVQPFVRVAFGTPYSPSVPILLWMLPGAFLLAMTSIASQYLAALGIPKALVFIWLAGLALMAALGVFLTPLYGGVGAAIALSLTYGLVFFLILSLARTVSTHRQARPLDLTREAS